MSGQADDFNDRIFGTCWVGIGLIILWMGAYVIAYLPQQPFGDVAYFISLIFIFLGLNQVRRGRNLQEEAPIYVYISQALIGCSFILYLGCLMWFKANLERLIETQANLAYLMYVIIAAFVLLSLGVFVNYLPKRD